MMMQALILAALGGWVFDDFCGTPPRPPWPWPGPWPWIRKILAIIGAIGAYYVFEGGVVNETLNAVAIIIVGGVGGAFLASAVSMVMGPRMER
jgi:hypothetical protein